MNDFVFKKKHLILTVIAFLVLSISCFALMREFFDKTTSDLLKIWLNTERVSLDQGNYISSFSKLQRSIGEGSYIKGFTVTDNSGRVVFSTGEIIKFSDASDESESFKIIERGFFSNMQQTRFSKLHMTVYSSSAELMYMYILIVGYIMLLSSVFAFFLKRIVTREEQVKTEKKLFKLTEISKINEAISLQAKQVAHDIRSPLSVLNMIIPMIKDESEEKTDLIKQAVDRINSISSELLNKGSVSNKYSNVVFKPTKLIQRIINEKNVASASQIVQLSSKETDDKIDICIKMKESDLERILSNLINNSIEAVDQKTGQVNCSFNIFQNHYEFIISDNGKGIPSHIIDKIGQRGFSFGKEGHQQSGSGLGLFHAKNVIEATGGNLDISSRINEGTVVTIYLPKS